MLLATGIIALAPGGVAPPAPSGEGDYTLTSRTIWSYYTETPPAMDDATDSVWDFPIKVTGLAPGHVALSGGTSLDIRSVYTDTHVYFRVKWQDVVENSDPPRWVYHNGNWTFTSPFVDGLGIYFPIADPTGNFPEEGCMRTCHAQDWENPKNQERKFTYTEGETGDLWFWSAGITNPHDFAIDAYVTDKPSDNNVGYYEDPEMDLGLVKNRHLTEYMEYIYLSRPVYMQDPNIAPSEDPAYILRGEDVVFDQNMYDPDVGAAGINPITHEPWRNGDVVGGYLFENLPERGLGEIDARGSYDILEQEWSVVLRRALDTGDPTRDIVFDDLSSIYYFAFSIFGDIMGGGDASEPFVEPDPNGEEETRCVMNKVTNTLALRFRPVLRAEMVGPGEPDSWDGGQWDANTPVYQHELIHRGGEIHDPWDSVNVSTAWDGERLFVYLRYEDPNETGALGVDMAWMMPGMVSVEETFHLLDWSDHAGHIVAEEGVADVWSWMWNATSLPEGEAVDMVVDDAGARADALGPDDLSARTWREGISRHVVLSRPLVPSDGMEDLNFQDMARTYVTRLAIFTEDRGEWLVSFPISAGFMPDPSDTEAPARVDGLSVEDGRNSDILLSWEASGAEDFGQYRVFVEEDAFNSIEDLRPSARVSDINITELHLRGIAPDRTYNVAVVAVDDNRNLEPTVTTTEVAVTDSTPPPRLAGVKVFDTLDSDLLISWEPTDAPDFDHYEVFLEEATFEDASGLTPAGTVRGMRVSSYRMGGLDITKTYQAAVVPVDWAGNALWSVSSIPGTPTDMTPPPEVRGIDASTPQDPESDGEVLLKWRAPGADDIATYNVYVSLTPFESVHNFAPIETVPADETSALLGDLRPGTLYHFAVTAVDRTDHEGPSKGSVSARSSTAEPPSAVVGLHAVTAGATSVRLAWEATNVSGAPVDRYIVYMSTSPITDLEGEDVEQVADVEQSSEPSCLLSDLETGVTYHFAVVVVDTAGHTSPGTPPTTSVSVPEPKDEDPSFWEVAGPPLAVVSLLIMVAFAVYVAISRQRRYGRLLARRPPWARKANGGKDV
jgi:hypothetical protein